MRSTLVFFLLAIAVFQLEAQNLQGTSPWNERFVPTLPTGTLAKNGLSVSKFKLFQLNLSQFSQSLRRAETHARNGATSTILPFPTVEGRAKRFKVWKSNTMHPALAEKFPTIQAYEGIGLDDPTATIRFEITSKGLTAMMWTSDVGTQVIQSLEANDQSDTYIVYSKKSASRQHRGHFACGTDHINQRNAFGRMTSKARFNDGMLRTYRLALAVTAEYTTLYGGTQGAMSQMVTTMNRVNGILKRDVAVEMQMVANNDQLIFTDNTKYSNNDSGAMLDENQTNIDDAIGNDNYDIGHVFSTGNGGVAYLASVCINEIKAGGVTGSQLPQGDAFDVDYVTHEIGHQLGANHTQNNDCQRTRATAVEPGSGSTIMGYAGICFPNVQSNSDDYFHRISIDQIKGFTTGTADNCAQKTATNNSRPTVDAGTDHTIPHSTPFELIGSGTDADGDALTYTWEQVDNQTATMPPVSSSNQGPLFRSVAPISSPIRQFPAAGSNKRHTPTTWEVLPSTGRTMNFGLTVRDNNQNGGNTATDDVTVTVAANAGPFKVNLPNGGETLAAGISQTITWDVAGSSLAPVNCATVDIMLSTDGGNTYPIVLAENVPNNGSAEVTFQNSAATSQARIKIKGNGNIFFDGSDNNFQINESSPGFAIDAPLSETVCQGQSVTIDVSVIRIENFADNVTLSTALPPTMSGASFNFSQNGDNGSATFTTSANTPSGAYDIVFTGVSGDLTVEKTVSLVVAPNTPPAVTLSLPADGATEVATMPIFEWSAVEGVSYSLTISDDLNFSNTIYSANNLTESAYALPFNLQNGQLYFWRIQTANDCGNGENSTTRSFTVTNDLCITYQNEADFVISDGLPTTTVSPIIVNETGEIQSVQVSVDIEHTWIGDLTLSLESPSGKKATLLAEVC
ncbi:MAG: reprolysin-like metallopeptidase, partial [Bacteroidota bacterium]